MNSFVVSIKFMTFEGFDKAVLRSEVQYKDKHYEDERTVEVPPFKSLLQRTIEQVLYEVAWVLRKEWDPENSEEFRHLNAKEEDLPLNKG